MTFFATDSQRRFDALPKYPIQRAANPQPTLWETGSQPGVLVSLIAILVTFVYQLAQSSAAARGRQLPTLSELLWNAVVFFTPAFILYMVDRWVYPPALPLPMLQPEVSTHTAKSDILRKILRLDQPGGLISTVSTAGRRVYSKTLEGFHAESSYPAGLVNMDNSCFQNSVLQGLASLQPLPPYLRISIPAEQAILCNDRPTTAGALLTLIAELNDKSNNGKTLWTPDLLKNMSTFQQQDAQEYFSILVERVEKDVATAAKAACKPPGFEVEWSMDETASSQHSEDRGYHCIPILSKPVSELAAIRNPLEGLSAQRVACTACGHTGGLSLLPFNCLTLNFELGHQQYDLYELLDNYVRLESIPNVDCVKCTLLGYQKTLQRLAQVIPAAAQRLKTVEKMLEEDRIDDKTLKELKLPETGKVRSTKTKQCAIGRAPASLVLHMNRSVFEPTTFQSFKNMAAVQFPKTLDLGPWCIGSAGAANRRPESGARDVETHQAKPSVDEEQWSLDPLASMIAGDAHPSKISGPLYELRAVVTHQGRHENGHYVCYRKHGPVPLQASEDGKFQKDASQPSHFVSAGGEADDIRPADELSPNAASEKLYGDESDLDWWRLSDESVRMMQAQDVLAQGGVFMLFYDRVDPNSVLVTSETSVDDKEQTTTTRENSPGPTVRESTSRSGNTVTTLAGAEVDHGDGISEVSSRTRPWPTQGHYPRGK